MNQPLGCIFLYCLHRRLLFTGRATILEMNCPWPTESSCRESVSLPMSSSLKVCESYPSVMWDSIFPGRLRKCYINMDRKALEAQASACILLFMAVFLSTCLTRSEERRSSVYLHAYGCWTCGSHVGLQPNRSHSLHSGELESHDLLLRTCFRSKHRC